MISAVLNIFGLKIPAFNGKILHTASNKNPFLIMMTFALFNLCRRLKFKSVPVNYISGLSLLIYIIHDSLIVRTYLRPYLINLVFERSGYGNKVLFVLLFAGATFLIFLAVAFCGAENRNKCRRGKYYDYSAKYHKFFHIQKIYLSIITACSRANLV